MVPLFDIVWDILPDGMHTLPGWLKAHTFPLFTGRRNPAKPKWRTTWSNEDNKKLQARHAEVLAEMNTWKIPKVVC